LDHIPQVATPQSGWLCSNFVIASPKTEAGDVDCGGSLEVEWNGGSVHTFHGVFTVLVQAERATNDRIIYYTQSI